MTQNDGAASLRDMIDANLRRALVEDGPAPIPSDFQDVLSRIAALDPDLGQVSGAPAGSVAGPRGATVRPDDDDASVRG